MKEVFVKIIDKLEERRILHADLAQSEHLTEQEQEVQARFCGCFCKAKEIVKQASSEYHDGWISCSSGRLPEAGDEFYPLCWVTLENGETCIGVYRHDNKKWYTKKTEGETEYTTERRVVAWQILPESYQPKKE